jgi:Tfp pilus assembly protein PilN
VSELFTINFRREAHRRELSEARRRAASLGAWVAYFGVLVVVLGLYGLNAGSLTQRAQLLDAHNARLQKSRVPSAAWTPRASELSRVEAALDNPRRWQARLERLAAVLPANAMLTSLVVNPDNLSAPADQDRLLIAGVLQPAGGRERMQEIMQLVSALRSDSLFAAQYGVIKLVESRIGGPGSPAEFRIECRR